MATISFVGQKGGSGKSTIACCYAWEFHQRGYDVLLVDADPQGSAIEWNATALGYKRQSATVISMGADMHLPGRLDKLSEPYDVTLIDCPGRESVIQRAAVMASDLCVLPVCPSPTDIWALGPSLDFIEDARGLHTELQAAILVNKTRSKNSRMLQAALAALEGIEIPLFETHLGLRDAYKDALSRGRGVTALNDPSGREFKALVDETISMFTGDTYVKGTSSENAA